jgi:hypothetical protein
VVTTRPALLWLLALGGLAGCGGPTLRDSTPATTKADQASSDGGTVDLASDPALTCGASPIAVSCATADGTTLALSTQINRDENADDFDGFITRHDSRVTIAVTISWS